MTAEEDVEVAEVFVAVEALEAAVDVEGSEVAVDAAGSEVVLEVVMKTKADSAVAIAAVVDLEDVAVSEGVEILEDAAAVSRVAEKVSANHRPRMRSSRMAAEVVVDVVAADVAVVADAEGIEVAMVLFRTEITRSKENEWGGKRKKLKT